MHLPALDEFVEQRPSETVSCADVAWANPLHTRSDRCRRLLPDGGGVWMRCAFHGRRSNQVTGTPKTAAHIPRMNMGGLDLDRSIRL